MIERDRLRDAIAAVMRSGADAARSRAGEVAPLAIAVHRYQIASNPLLAAMLAGPEPTRIEEIPAVPVSLFKDLDLGPVPPLPADVVFRTSGTTGQARGMHRSRDTFLYDLGAAIHFRRRVADPPRRIVSLCPAEADSSLGHMVAGFGEVVPCFGPGGVSRDAWEALRCGPIFCAATAFALDALFASPGSARLGPDSVVMVTGGFKGRQTRLDAPGLYGEIRGRLGSPRVVGEYGMTELSSQLWTDPVGAGRVPGSFLAPPWLRVYAADPASGRPVNRVGVLRFVDLANLDSVVAIETQDLGHVEATREGDRVTLLGRLDGAELRGCSLRAEGFARGARVT